MRTTSLKTPRLVLGAATLSPEIRNGFLHSLGRVQVGGTDLRARDTRFLPWFDTYDGDVFDRFQVTELRRQGKRQILELKALSSNDYPFREKRDSSGDPCFRPVSWDAPGLTATVRVVFEPAADTIDGHAFTGFRYWFEVMSPRAKLHRLLDRQTWELGGSLDKISLILRNWLTPPRVKLGKAVAYSTAGHEHLIGCMPGNLWARWSLLPAFDMQVSPRGVLLAHFDRVSLIRTLIETAKGEDGLRCLDMHYMESAHRIATNPKTILFCPDALDAVDTLNLWTRLHDRERDRARAQLGIAEEPPPAINLCQNDWINIRFDRNYNAAIDLAAELNADHVFIDPIWQNCDSAYEAIQHYVPAAQRPKSSLSKLKRANHCGLLDWEVDETRGGEPAVKRLVQYARKRNIGILSWMGAFCSPMSYWTEDHVHRKLGTPPFGVFAQKESGRHPDSGYPGDCWPLNLLGPIKEHVQSRILDVSTRLGLKGFLWDSFSNMGWWQINYGDGSMKPQFAAFADLYRALTEAGLYLMPEGIAAFSSHSCLGLHGPNPYEGEDLGYSYETNIHMPATGSNAYDNFQDCRILMGKAPIDELFRCVAHKRLPNFSMPSVPKDKRDPNTVQALRALFTVYKAVRNDMHRRTVLKGGNGVLWESRDGRRQILFAFKAQRIAGPAKDLRTGTIVSGTLQPMAVYELDQN